MPVYLVGAGPGDPELLTVKGRRLLRQADAVLYDELANPDLLKLAPRRAERCYVGKRAHRHALSQDELHAWMIDRARRGLRVVRLKGGDPFVFGRGGEEIEALARAGVEWEVVPGVSAGTSVAAVAGIPLTHRGVAAGVRFVTGHDPLQAQPAPGSETLVVFMGLERLRDHAAELIAAGWPAATPIAVLERGTLPGSRVVIATLATIAARVRRAGLHSPALIVVGGVVALERRWRKLARAPRRVSVAAEPPPALILMAHGSPLPGWQKGVNRLARELAGPGQFSRAAYLPPVQPGLGEVMQEAVAAGVRRVAVVPYFLAPGLHVSRDIPALVEAERRRYPRVQIELGECLEGHPALRTAVLARAGEVWTEREPPRPSKRQPPRPSKPRRSRVAPAPRSR